MESYPRNMDTVPSTPIILLCYEGKLMRTAKDLIKCTKFANLFRLLLTCHPNREF